MKPNELRKKLTFTQTDCIMALGTLSCLTWRK